VLVFPFLSFFYACFYLLIRRSLKDTSYLILQRMCLVVFVYSVLHGPTLVAHAFATDASEWNTLDSISLTTVGFANFLVWGLTNPQVVGWVRNFVYDQSEMTDFPSSDEGQTEMLVEDESRVTKQDSVYGFINSGSTVKFGHSPRLSQTSSYLH